MRIPVRQWTSEVDGPDAPPPAVPPLAAAKRNAIVVVLGTWFRPPAELCSTLLDDIDAARGEQDVLSGVSLTPNALRIDSPALENNLIRLHEVDGYVRRPVLLNRVTHALCRLVADGHRPVKVFFSHAKHDGVPITRRVRDFLQDGSGVDNFFDTQSILEGARWQDVIRGAAARFPPRHPDRRLRHARVVSHRGARGEARRVAGGGARRAADDRVQELSLSGQCAVGALA